MAKERKSLWGKCPDTAGRFKRTAEGIIVNGKLIKWVDFEMPGYIVELAKEIVSWEAGLGPCEMMFVVDAFAKHPRESRDEAFGIIYQSFAKSLGDQTNSLPPFLQSLMKKLRAGGASVVPISIGGDLGGLPPLPPEMFGQAQKVIKQSFDDGVLDKELSKRVMDRHPSLDMAMFGLYGLGLMKKEQAEQIEEACRQDPELVELMQATMDVALKAYPSVSGRPNQPMLESTIAARMKALGQPKQPEVANE